MRRGEGRETIEIAHSPARSANCCWLMLVWTVRKRPWPAEISNYLSKCAMRHGLIS